MRLQPTLFASALLLMGTGAAALFAPAELAALLARTGQPTNAMVIQLLGGALFALGFLDWMNRFATIGGIYGRPVVAANLAFFFIAATTFARRALRAGPGAGADPLTWAAFAVSALFAVAYARTMFAPARQAAPTDSAKSSSGEAR